MDLASKKRKADENGAVAAISPRLTPEDAMKILEPFSRDELLSIVSTAMAADPPSSSVLSSVRSVADADPTKRKLFIRGLGWETTSDSLRALFSSFGDLDEAIVICDKLTGKSKGYGFIVFKHVDGALLALKEPSKKIDGRMTVTQLASAGSAGGGPAMGPAGPAADVAQRKIYVGSVSADMSSERLLSLFSSYGEIEEGPLGFDKQTGKFRGYALFVYKHADSAQAAIAEPVKMLDGHQITCKLAIDGKKGRPGGPPDPNTGDASSFPGSMPSQYGGPGGGLPSYGGFSATAGFASNHHVNSPMQSSIGAGLSSMGGQVQSSALPGTGVGGGGYGSGLGGPYGPSSQYSGPGSGGFAGSGTGMGSSLYNRMPPASGGMGGGGGYPEGGPYSLSSMGYSGQHQQSLGSPPGPRVPPGGGMYQGMPHYF